MKRKAALSFVLIIAFLVSIFPMSNLYTTANSHNALEGFGTQSSIDWWPIFHHDLGHSGYSTSTAPNTNQTLWTYATGYWVDSSPAVVNGIVYVGSEDNYVYALNASTGALVWKFKTSNLVESSPAVVNGIVYVGSDDDYVYALNAATGALVWKFKTSNLVESSPAVVNGIVYVGSEDNYVYALNASTGALVWKYSTLGWIISSPAVANGIVYVGSGDDDVYALNAVTGVLVWKYATGSAVVSSPAVASGIVYVGSEDNYVYALNATNNGALVWKYKTGSFVESSPAVVNGIVYVGSWDDNVYALNAATGAFVWKYTTGSFGRSSPAVANGILYVGSEDYNVYALNAATGAFVWKYTTGSVVESSPAVVAGRVYVGSYDYKVYAFGLAVSVSISPNSVYMDVHQSRMFTSIVSAGVPPYSYQWYLNGTQASGAIGTSWTFTANSSGFYSIYLKVTDTLGGFATSNIVPTTVNVVPSVTASPSSAAFDIGQSQVFSSSGSGGTPLYTYQWFLNGVAVQYANSPTWNYTPGSSGSYSVYVNATDSVGLVAKSNVVMVTVNPTVSATVSPSSATLDVGQSQLFKSTVSAGTSPYFYQWYLNGTSVSGANSGSWNFTPKSRGSYAVYVKVTDSVGIQATSNVAAATVFIHDVAVTNVTFSKTIVGQGYNAEVYVTAADPGDFTETFNVTLYVTRATTQHTTLIATYLVTLASGTSTTVTFTWNTNGFAYGNYTVTGYAWPVQLDANLTNNAFRPSTQIEVTIPGDVGGYHQVNILDVVMITSIYGSKLGMPNFNPNCDIDGDGKITILDVVACTSHYFQKWP